MAQWQRIYLPMQETQVQSPGQKDPLEKEMATHSDILACEIPRTEEPGGLVSRVTKSRTRLKQLNTASVIDHKSYIDNTSKTRQNVHAGHFFMLWRIIGDVFFFIHPCIFYYENKFVITKGTFKRFNNILGYI